MCVVSFKERVKNEAVSNAGLYEKNYIQYEYLVCSEVFETGYHVIKCDKGNYLHRADWTDKEEQQNDKTDIITEL